jgi:hypothetical protein
MAYPQWGLTCCTLLRRLAVTQRPGLWYRPREHLKQEDYGPKPLCRGLSAAAIELIHAFADTGEGWRRERSRKRRDLCTFHHESRVTLGMDCCLRMFLDVEYGQVWISSQLMHFQTSDGKGPGVFAGSQNNWARVGCEYAAWVSHGCCHSSQLVLAHAHLVSRAHWHLGEPDDKIP